MANNLTIPGNYGEADDLAMKMLGETPPPAEGTRPAAPAAPPPPPVDPVEEWKKLLEKAKLTEVQARDIQRSVLRKGYWQKDYSLFNGELKITLRTRLGDHNQRLIYALDQLRNLDGKAESEMTCHVNLAGSLLRYNDGEKEKLFEFIETSSPTERDRTHQLRAEFVTTIPDPVKAHCFMVLANFDAIVYTAMANGSVGAF